tara:strand:- start:610 stop:1773 length:1164 start_codon:yes stop_codon:yes gene_type:complete
MTNIKKYKVLIIPCATQMAVEQYHSLKYNKMIELIGAAHDDEHDLFSPYIKLDNPVESPNLVQEVKEIVKEKDIDIIITSHDEMLYVLKNDSELEKLIPGSSKDTVNVCRFKSKSYEKLKTHPKLVGMVPRYQLLNSGFLKPDKGQGSRGSLQTTEDYLYCEYLPGKEYTVDCFTDNTGEVILVTPRLRKTIINGISEATCAVTLPNIKTIAHHINDVFNFKGPWFFQVKEDELGKLKFLEIAPRIAGASNINRLNGVNLTVSDIYQYLGHNTEFYYQNLVTDVRRKEPKYDINYDTIFVDYDDTFEYIEDILLKLNKEIIIITRSKSLIGRSYQTIYVKDHELKSTIINDINKSNPLFIDDSFRERKDVLLNCNIPCLSPEETNYL